MKHHLLAHKHPLTSHQRGVKQEDEEEQTVVKREVKEEETVIKRDITDDEPSFADSASEDGEVRCSSKDTNKY